MSGRLNIEIEQGATFRMRAECYSDDNVLVGFVEADLAEVRAHVRNGSDLAIALDCSWVGNGTVEFFASASDTAALAPGRYTWDLEIEFVSGDVIRLLAGIADVTAENTYDA
jgi:hypothetical protein